MKTFAFISFTLGYGVVIPVGNAVKASKTQFEGVNNVEGIGTLLFHVWPC